MDTENDRLISTYLELISPKKVQTGDEGRGVSSQDYEGSNTSFNFTEDFEEQTFNKLRNVNHQKIQFTRHSDIKRILGSFSLNYLYYYLLKDNHTGESDEETDKIEEEKKEEDRVTSQEDFSQYDIPSDDSIEKHLKQTPRGHEMIIPLGIKCEYTCKVKEGALEKMLQDYSVISFIQKSPFKFKGKIDLTLGFMESFKIIRTTTPPEEGSRKILTLDWVCTLPTIEWVMSQQIDAGVITNNCYLFTSDDNYESKMWKLDKDDKVCPSQEEEKKTEEEKKEDYEKQQVHSVQILVEPDF